MKMKLWSSRQSGTGDTKHYFLIILLDKILFNNSCHIISFQFISVHFISVIIQHSPTSKQQCPSVPAPPATTPATSEAK